MSNRKEHDLRLAERRQGDRRIVTIAVAPDRRTSDRRGHERRVVFAKA